MMSLQPEVVYLIPEDTAHLARTIFPNSDNPWMLMRNRLGMIYEDRDFAALYPHVGHAAASPHRLALAMIMQAGEHLTECQAANCADYSRHPRYPCPYDGIAFRNNPKVFVGA
jgi:hypothetical protein